MNFTKQDITKLAQKLAEVSVKDTQFKPVDNVNDIDKVPVIDKAGKNRLAALKLFSDKVLAGIDLSKIKISIEGSTSNNLASLLTELFSKLGNTEPPEDPENPENPETPGNNPPVVISADTIEYLSNSLPGVTSVEGALNALLVLLNNLRDEVEHVEVPVINYVLDNMLGISVMEADMPASVYYPNTKNTPAKYKGKIVRFDRVLNQDTDNYDIVETICDPDVCAIYFNVADESFYRYVGGSAPWSKISTSSSTPPPTTPTGFTLLVGDDSVIISAAPGSSSFTVTDDEIIIQQ